MYQPDIDETFPVPEFDASEPPGTSLNPLGWRPEVRISYLLGVACTCGTRSLVLASAADEPLQCPKCGANLR